MSSPLHTSIWQEEPEPDNPFATRAAYCHGFDVYGQMLGQARWVDMLFLLLRGEAPTPVQARVLETLAVALANPGPRDPMVHAAMCGGISGTPAAASLMAALAVGAGQSGGARDVFLAMGKWTACDLSAPHTWTSTLAHHAPPQWLTTTDAGWPAIEHAAGFDPNGVSTPSVVRQTLETLASQEVGPRTLWLAEHRTALEQAAGVPLAMTGIAAAALIDLGFSPAQGEMLYLLLRLPGAAAHALEQGHIGFKTFPYPPVELANDPHHNKEAQS